jgi:hypothetical protein
MRVKRRVVAAMMAAAIGIIGLDVSSAFADQPGPGDKQCIPGQQGNPHPGHKSGVCTNP